MFLKEAGYAHWTQSQFLPNVVGTNKSGFTALPFDSYGEYCGWWTSTIATDDSYGSLKGNPYGFGFGYDYDSMQYSPAYRKKAGFNVRCIKIK